MQFDLVQFHIELQLLHKQDMKFNKYSNTFLFIFWIWNYLKVQIIGLIFKNIPL